jgi:hypothetical protein
LSNDGSWTYDPDAPSPGRDPAVTRLLPAVPDKNAPVDVPPRVDDWCEDRDPDELSDDDERE